MLSSANTALEALLRPHTNAFCLISPLIIDSAFNIGRPSSVGWDDWVAWSMTAQREHVLLLTSYTGLPELWIKQKFAHVSATVFTNYGRDTAFGFMSPTSTGDSYRRHSARPFFMTTSSHLLPPPHLKSSMYRTFLEYCEGYSASSWASAQTTSTTTFRSRPMGSILYLLAVFALPYVPI